MVASILQCKSVTNVAGWQTENVDLNYSSQSSQISKNQKSRIVRIMGDTSWTTVWLFKRLIKGRLFPAKVKPRVY